jgi:phage N-6-adenine-methyltransferase
MLDDEHNPGAQGSDEWGTPVEIVERVRAFFGGEIDLDPASNETAQRIVRATQYYTKEQDGLKQEWLGNTFLNGPYSKMGPWVDKLVSEFGAGRVSQAICLVLASTGSEWFHRLWAASAAICFRRGRLRFLNANGEEAPNSPPMDPVLFYLGPRPTEFARAFGGPDGSIADPTRYRSAAGMAA